ncbi:MAG: LysR family transcriptional regulator [Polaromonas sp.]|jgi:LysR family glycine cleavage system transcriptional activator|nr:LysR family transcriptional regulator [Polaromonas sp.]
MHSRTYLPFTALRSFEAAARLLSFKAAAEELRVTPTSVSNQIRQLEADWGCQLFTRHTRRVELTDAGRSLSRVLSRAFDDIRAEVDVHVMTNRRTVTLAVGPIFGSRWLIPRLSRFYRQNPAIELVLHNSPRITSAEQLISMVGVDWGLGTWSGLEARRLFEIVYRPALSPALIEACGGLKRPADLVRYPIIHQWDREEWNAWFRLLKLNDLKFAQETTMRDSNMVLQAALDGHGVMMGTFPFLNSEVESGRLVCPFDTDLHPGRAYHLIHRPGARALPEVQAVCSWIESEAAAMA